MCYSKMVSSDWRPGEILGVSMAKKAKGDLRKRVEKDPKHPNVGKVSLSRKVQLGRDGKPKGQWA